MLLSRAINADDTLDDDVVEFVLTLAPGFEASRQLGAFAAPIGEIAINGSPQDRLLHLLGRRPTELKENAMSDLGAFLESTMPRLKAAETALHNGNSTLRMAGTTRTIRLGDIRWVVDAETRSRVGGPW